MNPTRVEMIHELVNRAVTEGLPNYQIKKRISSFAYEANERREGFEYLTLIRTKRGEELNVFSGESNVSDSFRSRARPASKDEVLRSQPRVESTAAPRTSRGFTERQIRDATTAMWRATGQKPSRNAVSRRLGTSEATLRRAMNDLGMGPWPPSPAED